MKPSLLLAALLLLAARLAAETLSADTAVFTQADAKSFVITRLKAGSTVTYVGDAPAGWRRVEVAGTFDAYAHSSDITKGLDVREGGPIYTAPAKTAALLTTAQAGDKSEVVGLVPNSDFCQVRVTKKLQGFVATGATLNTPATPAPAAAPAVTAAPPATNAPGRPVAPTAHSADTPRLFSGTLVLARRPIINPNPPYDYQLIDSGGRRFAYVDTKRLVLTDRIEDYLDRLITVTGTIRNTVDGKDLVVDAQSFSVR